MIHSSWRVVGPDVHTWFGVIVMGRPRKYVQVNGKEVTGVSKMSDGRFCIIVGAKQRRYFKTVQEARDAYVATQAGELTPRKRAELAASAEVRRTLAIQELKRRGYHNRLDDEVVIPAKPYAAPGGDYPRRFRWSMNSIKASRRATARPSAAADWRGPTSIAWPEPGSAPASSRTPPRRRRRPG